MEETIETPDGNHYDRCGEMKPTDESNHFITVTQCDGCDRKRVSSGTVTTLTVAITTVISAATVYTTDVATPAGATGQFVHLYPALGPILGILILVVGAYVLHHLTEGVAFDGGVESDE